MENSSNPATANPQDIGRSLESPANPLIQNTVDDDALRQQQEQLNVVSTGEPATQPQEIFSPVASNFAWWPLIIILTIVLGGLLLARLIRESQAEQEYIEDEVVVEARPKKNIQKKKSAKKKSAPNQRKKKVSKNKR